MVYKVFITEGMLDPNGNFLPIGKELLQIAIMDEKAEWRVDALVNDREKLGEVILYGIKAIDKSISEQKGEVRLKKE